jgi:hypothetical protein
MKEGELSTSKGFYPVNPVHPVKKMDPKVTQLRVDAFDAVKNADGRRQNVQKYLTPPTHGENQMNKDKWTKLWYDPFDFDPFEPLTPLTFDL